MTKTSIDSNENKEMEDNNTALLPLDTTAPAPDQIVLSGVERLGIQEHKELAFKQFLSSHQLLAITESNTWTIDSLFEQFLQNFHTGNLLNLQFPFHSTNLGNHWVTVALDVIENRTRESGKVTLELPDECFERVLCIGLDAISQPASLIGEIHRVLKPGGQIWVQAALANNLASGHESKYPTYWRFTFEGLRLQLLEFEEVASARHLDPGSLLFAEAFFYGVKPASDANTPSHVNP